MDAGDGRELGQRHPLEQPVVEMVGDLVEPSARLRALRRAADGREQLERRGVQRERRGGVRRRHLGREPAAQPRQPQRLGTARRQARRRARTSRRRRRGRRWARTGRRASSRRVCGRRRRRASARRPCPSRRRARPSGSRARGCAAATRSRGRYATSLTRSPPTSARRARRLFLATLNTFKRRQMYKTPRALETYVRGRAARCSESWWCSSPGAAVTRPEPCAATPTHADARDRAR